MYMFEGKNHTSEDRSLLLPFGLFFGMSIFSLIATWWAEGGIDDKINELNDVSLLY